jgi:thioredoxin-like negative regulator of GroEL
VLLTQYKRRKDTWFRRWRWRLIFGVLVAGTVGFFALQRPVSDYLAARRERRSLGQARQFAASGDFPQAMLAVRVAVQSSGENPEALRVAADILEQAGSAETVQIRQQVVTVLPASRDDRLSLVRSALQFHDLAEAKLALRGFSPADAGAPEVETLTAAVALAEHRTAAGEAALLAAAAQDPTNPRIRFDLAAIHLHAAEPATAAAGRQELETLAATGPLRQEARLELLRDSSEKRHFVDAGAWAKLLAEDPAATLDDQIRQLNTDLASRGSPSPAGLKRAAALAKTPAEIARLGTWYILTRQPQAGLEYLQAQPAAVRTGGPVFTVLADSWAALGRWREVEDLVIQGAWGPVAPESVETAMTVREMRERKRNDLAGDLWAEDLRMTRTNGTGLMVLLRLANQWQWPEGRIQTLDTIARYFPTERWALAQLLAYYYGRGETQHLQDVWAFWVTAHPTDKGATNDATMVRLLLEAGEPAPSVKKDASELYASDPQNPYYVVTQAFSLLRQHQANRALALLEKLPPEERDNPTRALYYGAALAANGRADEAATVLARLKGAVMLPEERTLLQEAVAEIQASLAPGGTRAPSPAADGSASPPVAAVP